MGEQRGSSLQVRLFAGKDPVTGRGVYLAGSIAGIDEGAQEGRGQARRVRHPGEQAAIHTLVGQARVCHRGWMRTSEHEDSTRGRPRLHHAGRSGPLWARYPSTSTPPGCWKASTRNYGVAGCRQRWRPGWWKRRSSVGREKDIKTRQTRWISLDTETIVLLREHKDRCRLRMTELEAGGLNYLIHPR